MKGQRREKSTQNQLGEEVCFKKFFHYFLKYKLWFKYKGEDIKLPLAAVRYLSINALTTDNAPVGK